ncbi:hypothetical protein QBC38DRAFT_440517 [Podospora fimiseda]|uniref:Uncharacterized protein n=1 Tax=Podospora fimiseda TaxID=252190 RepID=A0AAN7BX93_9PEZI|nr:hypothetical protein QBC38DRAFT_440517 [Podospora fimiseda]
MATINCRGNPITRNCQRLFFPEAGARVAKTTRQLSQSNNLQTNSPTSPVGIRLERCPSIKAGLFLPYGGKEDLLSLSRPDALPCCRTLWDATSCFVFVRYRPKYTSDTIMEAYLEPWGLCHGSRLGSKCQRSKKVIPFSGFCGFFGQRRGSSFCTAYNPAISVPLKPEPLIWLRGIEPAVPQAEPLQPYSAEKSSFVLLIGYPQLKMQVCRAHSVSC